MTTIKIDKEVNEKGLSLGLFKHFTRQEVERYCRDKSRLTGFKYDFFYEGKFIKIMTTNPNHGV